VQGGEDGEVVGLEVVEDGLDEAGRAVSGEGAGGGSGGQADEGDAEGDAEGTRGKGRTLRISNGF